MDTTHLNTKTPLGDKIDRIGEFVNVRRFERLMVCGHADVPLEIMLEWSSDGLEKAMESILNVPADQWKSQLFDVLMPFVRLHLINKCSGRLKPNKDLAVVTTPQGGAAHIAYDAPAEQEKRSRSPIRRFMDNIPTGKQSKRDSRMSSGGAYSSPSASRDDRIPEYIPENVLLIGGKSGRVQLLPRGNPGDVLTVNSEGKVIWANLLSLMSATVTSPAAITKSASGLSKTPPPSETPTKEKRKSSFLAQSGSDARSSSKEHGSSSGGTRSFKNSFTKTESFDGTRSLSSNIKLSFSSIPPPTEAPPELPSLSPSHSVLDAQLPARLSIASVDAL